MKQPIIQIIQENGLGFIIPKWQSRNVPQKRMIS